MRTCTECGQTHNRTAPLCQRCYMYFRKHPQGYYPIPPKGSLSFATNGDPICHECGGAYSKLGNHIRQVHDMTIIEYKDKHNLLHNTQLTSEKYKTKMRNYTKKYYRKVMAFTWVGRKGDSELPPAPSHHSFSPHHSWGSHRRPKR